IMAASVGRGVGVRGGEQAGRPSVQGAAVGRHAPNKASRQTPWLPAPPVPNAILVVDAAHTPYTRCRPLRWLHLPEDSPMRVRWIGSLAGFASCFIGLLLTLGAPGFTSCGEPVR